MPKLTVWLIRHGESLSNTGTWVADVGGAPLTETGWQQAHQAAACIKTCPDLLIVSSCLRAIESAVPIVEQWPNVKVETWPMQEIVYLSPTKYQDKTKVERKAAIENYWKNADPDYSDNDGAESFSQFVQRVIDFHERLMQQHGFIVVVGHGQFFKAYLLGLEMGFEITSDWMKKFREVEVSRPIANGEIVALTFET